MGTSATETARSVAFCAHTIFLINQLMDEVRFAEGGRELHMRKRHTAAAGLP